MPERRPPFFERARVSELLERAGADLLLACSRQNVGYLSDYVYYVGQGLPTVLEDGREWSLACVGIPRDDRLAPFMTVQTAEEHLVARADPWIEDRRVWGPTFRYSGADGSRSPATAPERMSAALVAAIRDRGLTDGIVALETTTFPVDESRRLTEALPGLRFVDPWPVLWELRLRKSAEELERLRIVAAITDAAIAAGSRAMSDDLTELRLRSVLASQMVAMNADFGWTSIAYGPKGALVIEPTERPPVRGEIARVDLVGSYRGYYSDMSRVAVYMGTPSAETQSAHDAILATNELMRRETGPGVSCSALYRLASDSIARHGYETLALEAGHGIGRDVGEPPYLTAWDDTVLEPGMVICLEPAIRVTGVGSVNVEDMVVITENGCEVLTNHERGLAVWPPVS